MKQENNEGHFPNLDNEEKESSSSAMKRSHDETSSTGNTSQSRVTAERPNNQSSRDPREVLRASLQFQQQRELQRYSDSSSLITSTSSLYPSVESVNRAARGLDIETDWSNANVSQRQTVVSTSQHAATPLVHATTSLQGDIDAPTITPVAVSSAIAEAAAEVTIIEDERVHPLEVQSVVQAELVNEGASGHELHLESTTNQDHQSGDATEATVIESGPAEKATIAAWSGHSTEVVTLPQESFTTEFESVDDLDAKHSSSPNERRLHHLRTIRHEFSVEDLLNPSEHTNGLDDSHSTRAEFIGLRDSHSTLARLHDSHSTLGELVGSHSTLAELVEDIAPNDLVSEGVAVVAPTGEDNESNVATEATVLDCGPPEKATVDAWSAPEEAQVISHDYDTHVSTCVGEEEIIPSACVGPPTQNFSTTDDDQTAIRDSSRNTDSQAEIVEISDHVHPLELEMENATTAQLIGNPEGIVPVFDAANTESTAPDFFIEDDTTTSQAPLVPSIEAQNDNEGDMDSQDMKLPATIHEEEVIPLATIDGEQIQVDPLRQTMANDSDNLDNSADVVPIETAEVVVVRPQVPEPRPFASLSNQMSTDSERNRSDSALRGVQVVSTSRKRSH